jgi:hypothetical protein
MKDKLSNNWKDSSKGETYSSLDDIVDNTLKTTMETFMNEKPTEPFSYDGYYFVGQSWVQKDKETKEPVLKDGKEQWNKFVYRFNNDEKDKAIEKAKPYTPKSGSGKTFAPRKEYAKSYRGIVEVDLHDYGQQEEEAKLGKIIITAQDLGRSMIEISEKDAKTVYMGVPYKVEL